LDSCPLNPKHQAPNTKQIQKLKFKKTVFDNGLTLVSERLPDFRSLSVGVWVKTGTRHESLKIAGASHFLEHMLFKGTTQRPAGVLDQLVRGAGGDNNAYIFPTLPPQTVPGWRYWHLTLSNVTGGALLDDKGGNVQVIGSAPSVSFLLSHSSRGESSSIGWLVRSGDCSATLAVHATHNNGTLTDIGYGGTDWGGLLSLVDDWTMAPGQCALSIAQRWQPEAIKGHAGTWTITSTVPPLPIGRVPEMTFEVQ